MRKIEIAVLIILFTALAYVGVVEKGRNRIVVVAAIAILAALAYGTVLLEKMYRKARRPGTSIFSIGTMFRALFTKEGVYYVLLLLGMTAFGGVIVAMDKGGGYLSP